MLEVDAIILAAGLSRRMGSNKLLLPFRGITVIEQLIQAIPRQSFQEVILITSDSDVAGVASKHIDTTIEIQPGLAKSQSIHKGLEVSKARDGVMFFVGDQPMLGEATIVKLLRTYERNRECIIIPNVAGVRRNPVIFPCHLKKSLFNLRGNQGGRDIFEIHQKAILEVEFEDGQQFEDIDTPEKYKRVVEQCKTVE